MYVLVEKYNQSKSYEQYIKSILGYLFWDGGVIFNKYYIYFFLIIIKGLISTCPCNMDEFLIYTL
jgi:hypothetical protein